MNEKNDYALVPKPPGAIGKAEPGAKGILANMVADILTQAPGEDPESSFQKARAYLLGDGVSQDSVEAVKWYRMAAEQGHRAAQFHLGRMYANGDGVDQDEIEANKWHRRAIEQRAAHQDYNYDLGKKPVETVEWYRKAAEQGSTSAQYNLGVIYANGIGVAQDRTDAEKWYRKAAEQGHRDAQSYLGQMYANGDA